MGPLWNTAFAAFDAHTVRNACHYNPGEGAPPRGDDGESAPPEWCGWTRVPVCLVDFEYSKGAHQVVCALLSGMLLASVRLGATASARRLLSLPAWSSIADFKRFAWVGGTVFDALLGECIDICVTQGYCDLMMEMIERMSMDAMSPAAQLIKLVLCPSRGWHYASAYRIIDTIIRHHRGVFGTQPITAKFITNSVENTANGKRGPRHCESTPLSVMRLGDRYSTLASLLLADDALDEYARHDNNVALFRALDAHGIEYDPERHLLAAVRSGALCMIRHIYGVHGGRVTDVDRLADIALSGCRNASAIYPILQWLNREFHWEPAMDESDSWIDERKYDNRTLAALDRDLNTALDAIDRETPAIGSASLGSHSKHPRVMSYHYSLSITGVLLTWPALAPDLMIRVTLTSHLLRHSAMDTVHILVAHLDDAFSTAGRACTVNVWDILRSLVVCGTVHWANMGTAQLALEMMARIACFCRGLEKTPPPPSLVMGGTHDTHEPYEMVLVDDAALHLHYDGQSGVAANSRNVFYINRTLLGRAWQRWCRITPISLTQLGLTALGPPLPTETPDERYHTRGLRRAALTLVELGVAVDDEPTRAFCSCAIAFGGLLESD